MQMGVWQRNKENVPPTATSTLLFKKAGSRQGLTNIRRSDSIMSMEDAIEAACVSAAASRPLADSHRSTENREPPAAASLAVAEAGAGTAAAGGPEERRELASRELLEAREKGRAECIEMACKSSEAAGFDRHEVASLRSKLQRLCLARLEAACAVAEAQGVAASEVSEARVQARRLSSEVRRLQVAAELLEARQSGSLESIKEACVRAESAGLSKADVGALQRKLRRLYAACIEDACRRAEVAGVARSEVDEARAEAEELRASAGLLAATGDGCLRLRLR